MQHDLQAHLWDILESIDRIDRYSHQGTLEIYLQSDSMQDSVERRLQIIGDALKKAGELSPVVAEKIPWAREIIAFRNRLVHGYRTVNNQIVWEIIKTELPELRAAVVALLPASDV